MQGFHGCSPEMDGQLNRPVTSRRGTIQSQEITARAAVEQTLERAKRLDEKTRAGDAL
jgi:hypothetical protein